MFDVQDPKSHKPLVFLSAKRRAFEKDSSEAMLTHNCGGGGGPSGQISLTESTKCWHFSDILS